MTELTQQLKAAETAAETSTSGGGEGATGSQTDSAALEEQNARLREALSKLREVTAAEKIDLTTRLRAAEKLASEHAAGAQKAAASSEQVAVLEAQVLELKEQLDVATEYDAMVCTGRRSGGVGCGDISTEGCAIGFVLGLLIEWSGVFVLCS